jgi:hypothetical protein
MLLEWGGGAVDGKSPLTLAFVLLLRIGNNAIGLTTLMASGWLDRLIDFMVCGETTTSGTE